MSSCGNCGTPEPIAAYQPYRCRRCGTVSNLGERISPMPLPVDAGSRQMPWMPFYSLPIHRGMYHVRFRSTEPQHFALYWDGRRFVHEGRRVLMNEFMTWRGSWE